MTLFRTDTLNNRRQTISNSHAVNVQVPVESIQLLLQFMEFWHTKYMPNIIFPIENCTQHLCLQMRFHTPHHNLQLIKKKKKKVINKTPNYHTQGISREFKMTTKRISHMLFPCYITLGESFQNSFLPWYHIFTFVLFSAWEYASQI